MDDSSSLVVRMEGRAMAGPSGMIMPLLFPANTGRDEPRTSFLSLRTSLSNSWRRWGDTVSIPGEDTVFECSEDEWKEMLKPTKATERMKEIAMNVVELTLICCFMLFDFDIG